MSAPVVDAVALGEFLGRSESALEPGQLARISGKLGERARWARAGGAWGDWNVLFSLAPATRRLPAEERAGWQERLSPVAPLLAAGDAAGALDEILSWQDRPDWLIDWTTFWLHLAAPEHPWWARWIYAAQPNTGAMPLLLTEPGGLTAGDVRGIYEQLAEGWQFLGSVLVSLRRLLEVEEPERPLVALSLVYGTYLYTLASWRLSEEFTAVLGPVAQVLEGLLGIRRWEAMRIGAQGQVD